MGVEVSDVQGIPAADYKAEEGDLTWTCPICQDVFVRPKVEVKGAPGLTDAFGRDIFTTMMDQTNRAADAEIEEAVRTHIEIHDPEQWLQCVSYWRDIAYANTRAIKLIQEALSSAVKI
jgi:hypothetical protein